MNHVLRSLSSLPFGSEPVQADQQMLDLARIIDARRLRRQFFASHLFFDPAWDVLLALALADLEQRRVTVSQLCGAAGAPNTTALRYIQAMIDQGLINRIDDPLDGRRKFVSLSRQASLQMTNFLEATCLSKLKAA